MIGTRVVLLDLLLGALPGPATAGPARVEVRDGLVSATFDATPASEAASAIRQATGVELVLPAAAPTKPLTLAVDRVPVDRLLARLPVALDLGGFALVYEPGGTPGRVIVVEKASAGPATVAEPAPRTEPGRAPDPVEGGGEGAVPAVAVGPEGEKAALEAHTAPPPRVMSAEEQARHQRAFEAALTTIPPRRLGLPLQIPPEQMLPFPPATQR